MKDNYSLRFFLKIFLFLFLLSFCLNGCISEIKNSSNISSQISVFQNSSQTSSLSHAASSQNTTSTIDYNKIADVTTGINYSNQKAKIYYLLNDGTIYKEGHFGINQYFNLPTKIDLPEPVYQFSCTSAATTHGNIYFWDIELSRQYLGKIPDFLSNGNFCIQFDKKIRQIEEHYADTFLLTEDGELYFIGEGSLFGYPSLIGQYPEPSEKFFIPTKIEVPEKIVQIFRTKKYLFLIGESGKFYYAYCFVDIGVNNQFIPPNGKAYSYDTQLFKEISLDSSVKQIAYSLHGEVFVLTENGKIFSWNCIDDVKPGESLPVPNFQEEKLVAKFPEGELEGKKVTDIRSYPGVAFYIFLEDGTIWREVEQFNDESSSLFFKADDDHLRIGKLEYPITMDHS